MDDDLDANTCEICFLAFNNSNHLPKIIECCNHTFCLQCLNQIYAKNNNKLMCSICRKFTDKNPISLSTDQSKFPSPKPKCPQCKKETEVNSLFVKINEYGNSTNFIFCNKCVESDLNNRINRKMNNNNNDNSNNNFGLNNQFNNYGQKPNINNSSILFENLSLNDFLETLKIELNFLSTGNLQLLGNLNGNNLNQNNHNNNNKKVEEILDMKIMKFVDLYFEKLKRNIKIKIKQFMNNYLFDELGFNFQMEQEVNKFNSDLAFKINNLISEVNSIPTNQINEANIAKINKAILIYLHFNSLDSVIQGVLGAKSFIECLSFDFAISNNENFEELIVNNLELKQNNELFFSNVENYEMKNSTKEFASGIKLIDNEFLKLKTNINNYALCFSDYGSLTQKNEDLVKQLNEVENKYSTLSNSFADILNENNQLNEANKLLEQQLSDFLVKNESNSQSKGVKDLEEKLRDSQVSLAEQMVLVAQVRKQLKECFSELERTKKEKQILEMEREKFKSAKKPGDKVNQDENEVLKRFKKAVAVVDDKNFDEKLTNKRAQSYNYGFQFPTDLKKNVFEDINCSLAFINEEENESDGRRSKLHRPNVLGGLNNARINLLTQRADGNSTTKTDLGENDDFFLFGSG